MNVYTELCDCTFLLNEGPFHQQELYTVDYKTATLATAPAGHMGPNRSVKIVYRVEMYLLYVS